MNQEVGGVTDAVPVAEQGSPWGHLLAGASAGAVSRTLTAPLETLRLQAMTSPQAARGSLVQQAVALAQASGWRALYAGNGVNVMRSAPQKAMDFFWFDLFKVRRQPFTLPASCAALL